MPWRDSRAGPHFGSGIIPGCMSIFLFKRLITLIATLVGASAVVFLVLEILPGNAAQILMGPDASPEAVHALAVKLGLDRAPIERYWDWVSGMLTGNLGL